MELSAFHSLITKCYRERKAYKDGSWLGRERPSEENVECNFHMARILQYLECPQYLRKAFFPIQAPLKFAGTHSFCIQVVVLLACR